MAQAIEDAIGMCPLCGEDINLNIAAWKISAKWRDVIEHRDKWASLSKEFRQRQSIVEAARLLSIEPELAARLLDFLCSDLCGCRAVTCVSCLDDYRSEL